MPHSLSLSAPVRDRALSFLATGARRSGHPRLIYLDKKSEVKTGLVLGLVPDGVPVSLREAQTATQLRPRPTHSPFQSQSSSCLFVIRSVLISPRIFLLNPRSTVVYAALCSCNTYQPCSHLLAECMLRYSSTFPDEAMSISSHSNMRAIPPVYFRSSSPNRSRASTSLSASQPIPIQLQVPSMRSSASSAANNRSESFVERERKKAKERERDERRVPIAPVMKRTESSSTSSSSGSSRGYSEDARYYCRQEPSPRVSSSYRRTSGSISTSPTTPPSSSPSSRTRSRRQSITQTSSKPYPAKSSRKDRVNEASSDDNPQPDYSIPRLREALNSLESQMANLQVERQRLETRLEHAVREQSPVHRLPRELLGHIFEIGVHRTDAEDAVLLSTLMRVCKTWTEIALNTSTLWSRILVDGPASLPKTRIKLQRSRAAPLDITIQFRPTVDPDPDASLPLRGGQGRRGQAIIETVVHAMDLLQPALWRWRSFRLAVPTHAHAVAALSQLTEPAPILEVLAVQVHHVMYDSAHHPPSRSRRAAPLSLNAFMDEEAGVRLFGGQTPRLRRCALTSFDAGWGGPLLRGLTVLRLGGFWNGAAPSVRVLVEVLRSCPNLEELSLRNMSDIEDEENSEVCSCYDFEGSSKSSRSQPHPACQSRTHTDPHSLYPRESDMIHLPRLKTASFYYSGPVRTAGLLAQMSFPALERLGLSYLGNITPVLTHVKRQACSSPADRASIHGGSSGRVGMRMGLPLRALRIETCLFNALKLVRLLRRLPTLRTFELVDVEDASASFLKGLSGPYQNNEWICPFLDTLSFDGCSALPWDALRTLVESRLPPEDSAGARLTGPARSRTGGGSSASAYAAQQGFSASSYATGKLSTPSSAAHSSYKPEEIFGNEKGPHATLWDGPSRFRAIDLTRCPQISKEMIAWLRMYVEEVHVRRETEHTYWGEFGFAI